jgi:hypothetical protein
MMVTLLDKIINQARVVEAFSRTKDRYSWLEARQQLENLKGELLVTISWLTAEVDGLKELVALHSQRIANDERTFDALRAQVKSLTRERDEARGKVELLEKELAGWVGSHDYSNLKICQHDWETWESTGGESRQCKKCGLQESWTDTTRTMTTGK